MDKINRAIFSAGFSAICIILLVSLLTTVVGCAKIINTETEVVSATIIDVDRDSALHTGTIHRSADYDILLKHKDNEIWVDISADEYYKYKDLVGTDISVNLITNYYDDNTIEQRFELIHKE